MVLGIDISKASFDAVLLFEEKPLHKAFTNDPKGFKELQRWLLKAVATQVHACMEVTGTYGNELAEFLHNNALQLLPPGRAGGRPLPGPLEQGRGEAQNHL